MFERFADEARAVVVGAQQEARSLGHGWIGTEHLLLAALADVGSPVARALAPLGVTAEAVRARVQREVGSLDQADDANHADHADDDTALRDLGIDPDAVRARVEARFGPGALDQPAPPRRRPLRWRPSRRAARRRTGCRGHIPFTPRAKKSLELSLREALQQSSREIRVAHLVLGIMRTDGLAAGVVSRLGVRPDDVRRAVIDLARAA